MQHVQVLGEMPTGFWWGKKPIGKSSLKREYNIKNFLKKQWDCVDWTDLAQDRDNSWAVLKPLMNFGDP